MRHTFAKLAAVLMVLAVMLTGCNLVDVNQSAVIEQQFAELKEEMSAVLAEYDGGTVTVFDAMAPFYSNYNYMYQMYTMFGMELSDEDVVGMQEDAVESEVVNRAIAMEFEARGLTLDVTAEEIEAEVEENYASGYDYYYDYVEGETEEEKSASIEMALYSEGYSRDRLRDMLTVQYQSEALQEAVEAEITEVSEEELQTAYDEHLAADEEAYTADPTSFESDAMEEDAAICWIPEGYRSVKHVLVIPEEDVLQAVTDARDALESAQSELDDCEAELETIGTDDALRTEEEIQADIDALAEQMSELEADVVIAEQACLDSVQEKTDAIYAELAAGKSFDEVMAAYGEDPGMQSEPNMTNGYYVCADAYIWDDHFTAGSMALEQVGDYSETPVITSSGVHIIYYNADVTSGPVAFEDVCDALETEVLDSLRTEHYQDVLSDRVASMNVVYHIDEWVNG